MAAIRDGRRKNTPGLRDAACGQRSTRPKWDQAMNDRKPISATVNISERF
jgi:hypothetical protein